MAAGTLAGCRRGDGGVLATISVAHRSGGPGVFQIDVGLVDGAGRLFARGRAETPLLDRGATAAVDVLVAGDGTARGACELLGVTATGH